MFLPRLTKRLTVKRTVTAPTCVVVPANPVAAGRVCALAVPAALANEAAHASAPIVAKAASTARCLRDMLFPLRRFLDSSRLPDSKVGKPRVRARWERAFRGTRGGLPGPRRSSGAARFAARWRGHLAARARASWHVEPPRDRPYPALRRSRPQPHRRRRRPRGRGRSAAPSRRRRTHL